MTQTLQIPVRVVVPGTAAVINVRVTDPAGTVLPGSIGRGSLLVGTPVTASLVLARDLSVMP